MDQPGHSTEVREIFHRDLDLIHRLLGFNAAVLRRLGPEVRSVVELGCGDGKLLHEIRQKWPGVEVTGVDLEPCVRNPWKVPMVCGDATRMALPQADVAVSVLMLHHLSDPQVVRLIRNVGRSSKRLLVIDLVRRRLPMVLFSAFIGPLVHRIAAVDGRQSIRRAFRPEELQILAEVAVLGTGARVEQWVSGVGASQILDIRW